MEDEIVMQLKIADARNTHVISSYEMHMPNETIGRWQKCLRDER